MVPTQCSRQNQAFIKCVSNIVACRQYSYGCNAYYSFLKENYLEWSLFDGVPRVQLSSMEVMEGGWNRKARAFHRHAALYG